MSAESVVTTAVLFALSELVLFFLLFRLLARRFLQPDPETPPRVTATDFAKGALERLVVAYGLFLDLPHILTLFGALKLGTRLKTETETPQFNNFFLIGNLVSVLVAMLYATHLPTLADRVHASIARVAACLPGDPSDWVSCARAAALTPPS